MLASVSPHARVAGDDDEELAAFGGGAADDDDDDDDDDDEGDDVPEYVVEAAGCPPRASLCLHPQSPTIPTAPINVCRRVRG
jgi:hypothetical protein